MLRRGQASRSPISPKKQTWANLLVLSSLSVYAIFLALTVCQFKCWNFCTLSLADPADVPYQQQQESPLYTRKPFMAVRP